MESSSSDGNRGTNVQCTLGGRTTQGEVTTCGQGVRERDPTMFAAASDTAVSGRIQGGNSKLQHVHVRCDVGALITSSEVRKQGSEVSQWNHPGHGCGKETIVADLLTFLSK